MQKEESHVMHNITQYLILPVLIALVSILTWPSLDILDIFIMSFFGSVLPDVDHINIWFEYKFKDFKSFLKFLFKARRYRYSFLIFHNLAAMFFILMLIPIVNLMQPLGTVFLAAFLSHLVLDFFDDKVSIGRVTHWRYRKRT